MQRAFDRGLLHWGLKFKAYRICRHLLILLAEGRTLCSIRLNLQECSCEHLCTNTFMNLMEWQPDVPAQSTTIDRRAASPYCMCFRFFFLGSVSRFDPKTY